MEDTLIFRDYSSLESELSTLNPDEIAHYLLHSIPRACKPHFRVMKFLRVVRKIIEFEGEMYDRLKKELLEKLSSLQNPLPYPQYALYLIGLCSWLGVKCPMSLLFQLELKHIRSVSVLELEFENPDEIFKSKDIDTFQRNLQLIDVLYAKINPKTFCSWISSCAEGTFVDTDVEGNIYFRKYHGLLNFFRLYDLSQFIPAFEQLLSRNNHSLIFLLLLNGAARTECMARFLDTNALKLSSWNDEVFCFTIKKFQKETFSNPICTAMLNQDPQVALSSFSNSDNLVVKKFSLRLLLSDECSIPEEDFSRLITHKVLHLELIRSHSLKSTTIRHKLKTKIPDVYGFCIDALCNAVSTVPTLKDSDDDFVCTVYCKYGVFEAIKSASLSFSQKKILVNNFMEIMQRIKWHNKNLLLKSMQSLDFDTAKFLLENITHDFAYITKYLTRNLSCLNHLKFARSMHIKLTCPPGFNYADFFAQMLALRPCDSAALVNFIDFTGISDDLNQFLNSKISPLVSFLEDVDFLNELTNEEKANVRQYGFIKTKPAPLEKRKDNAQVRIARINDMMVKRTTASDELYTIFTIFARQISSSTHFLSIIWQMLSTSNFDYSTHLAVLASFCSRGPPGEGLWLLSPDPITISPASLKSTSLPFLVSRMQKYHHVADLPRTIKFLQLNTIPVSFDLFYPLLECMFQFYDTNELVLELFKVLTPTQFSSEQSNLICSFLETYILGQNVICQSAAIYLISNLTITSSPGINNRLYVLSFSTPSETHSLYDESKISYKYLKDLLLEENISELFFRNLSQSIVNSSLSINDDDEFLTDMKELYSLLLKKMFPVVIRGSKEGIDLTFALRVCLLETLRHRDFSDKLPLIQFCVETVFNDSCERVREAAMEACKRHVTPSCYEYLYAFLNRSSGSKTQQQGHLHIYVIILISQVTTDKNELSTLIKQHFFRAIRSSSEFIQRTMSDFLFEHSAILEADWKQTLLVDLLDSKTIHSSRRGCAYALLAFHFDYDIFLDPFRVGASSSKLGALYAMEIFATKFKLRFEPWSVMFLPVVLSACSDNRPEVREAAEVTCTSFFSNTLGTLGFRHALSIILDELEEKRVGNASTTSFDLSDSLNWRGKSNCCKWIHVVVDKAPPNAIHALFPRIILILSNVLSTSPHPQVQASAREALFKIAASLKCPEFANFSSLIVESFLYPTASSHALETLNAILITSFSNTLDSASLAFLVTFLDGCISKRNMDTTASISLIRQKACIIIGCIASLLIDPILLSMFQSRFQFLMLSVLSDSVFETQLTSSKAIASITKILSFLDSAGDTPYSHRIIKQIENGVKFDSRQSQIGSGIAIAEILAVSGADQTASYLRAHRNFDSIFVAILLSLPEAYETNSSNLGSLYSVCALDSYVPQLLALINGDSTNYSDFTAELAMKAVKKILIRHHKILGLERVFEIVIDSFESEARSIIFLLQILTELISLIIPEHKVGYGAEYLLSSSLLTRRALHRLLSKILIFKYARGFSDDKDSVSEFNSIRSLSTALWKTLVSHPPKTVIDIIPILCHDLTSFKKSTLEFGKECMLDLMERFGERFYMPFLTNLAQLDSTLPEVFRVISWVSEFRHFRPNSQGSSQIPEHVACKIVEIFVKFIRTELTSPALQYNSLTEVLNNMLPLISNLNLMHLLVNDLDANSLSKLMDHDSEILADAILSSHITPSLVAKAPTNILIARMERLLNCTDMDVLKVLLSKTCVEPDGPTAFLVFFKFLKNQEKTIPFYVELFSNVVSEAEEFANPAFLEAILNEYEHLILGNLDLLLTFAKAAKKHASTRFLLSRIASPTQGAFLNLKNCCDELVFNILLPLLELSEIGTFLNLFKVLHNLPFSPHSLTAISGQLIRTFTSSKSPMLIESINLLLENNENASRLKAFYPQFLRVMQTGDSSANQDGLKKLFLVLSAKQRSSLLESLPVETFSKFYESILGNLQDDELLIVSHKIISSLPLKMDDPKNKKLLTKVKARLERLENTDLLSQFKQFEI